MKCIHSSCIQNYRAPLPDDLIMSKLISISENVLFLLLILRISVFLFFWCIFELTFSLNAEIVEMLKWDLVAFDKIQIFKILDIWQHQKWLQAILESHDAPNVDENVYNGIWREIKRPKYLNNLPRVFFILNLFDPSGIFKSMHFIRDIWSSVYYKTNHERLHNCVAELVYAADVT